MDSQNHQSAHLFMIMMVVTPISSSIFFFLLLHSPSPTEAMATFNNDNNNNNNNAHEAPSSLVNRVCQKTTIATYTDCVAALALDPRTRSASNLKTLAKIALDLSVTNSTKSKEFIDTMARSESSSPSLKRALEYCVLQYQSVVSSFESALNEVDEDAMTASYDAKVASDGAYYCEKRLSFADVPSVTTRNNYVKIYSDIGFVVTNMLSS